MSEYTTWVLSCSLRCAHYVNENQRRYVNFAPLLFVNITFKNKFG